MVVIDFSSIIHRTIHSSIANIKPTKEDGKYITSEFVGFTKHLILQELFTINTEHSRRFGDLVICLDKSAGGYWRKDVYPGYKAGRKKGREESEIDFKEVFVDINEFIENIREHLPWKVLEVPRAEADDIMLVLAKEFSEYEKILIHSPDKDMLQAQRGTDNVSQYSALTKKWLVAETKHDHMDHWILEHVCLGDESDEVPKVVDHTEFSDAFLAYLEENGKDQIKTPHEFKNSELSKEEKMGLLGNFDVFKTNRKGESTGEKDVYKKIPFGPSKLKKVMEKHGSLDEWLDSHPLYRAHYERNYTLVMEEGIPEWVRKEILEDFKNAKTEYHQKEFEEYLKKAGLSNLAMELPSHFKFDRELTIEDFDW